jgi:hypothetical protein
LIAAPTARDVIAQGNALGEAIQSGQALKARNQNFVVEQFAL